MMLLKEYLLYQQVGLMICLIYVLINVLSYQKYFSIT